MTNRYRLVKEYPGSPKLGSIANKKDVCDFWYIKDGFNNVGKNIEKYPEFWEEVVEKDYEILSFSKNLSTEVVKVSKIDLALSVEEFFKNVCWNIHSVKRLSDGEVFTIGDKINHYAEYKKDEFSTKEWIILRIYFIEPNRLAFYVGKGLNLGIKNISKGKQPLFTTEDGVDIFKNIDKYYTPIYIVDKALNIKYCEKDFSVKPSENVKYFSTKEKAEEYILMNKPCLSLKEIENYSNITLGGLKSLKELVKTKLK